MPRAHQTRRRASPEINRSPRSLKTRRSNLSSLDLEEDDDEEYNEQIDADESLVKESDDEDADLDEEDDDEEEDEEEKTLKKSSRKRKAPVTDDEEEDDNEDQDEDREEGNVDDDLGEGEEEDEEEDEEEEEEENEDVESSKGTKNVVQIRPEEKRRGPKKRGRKKIKITIMEDGVFDEEGNPLNINDDEVVIENEDPKGKEKIDEFGKLQGGRHFRMKTFTLLGKGEKLYMVSTEPARLVGFRDSYLLFKTHRSLFKKVCTNEEKMDLIDRHIIPNSYKGRSVNLVAARSIFREFGAKVIHDGKKVIDDFWEQRAINNGDVAGEYADPGELYRNPNKISTLGDSTSNAGATPISGAALVNYQTDPTWMYQIVMQTREYNSKLLEQRKQGLVRGIKDVYTGLNFYPLSTQPTHFGVSKLRNTNESSITYNTRISNPNIRRKITGLSSISKEIFNELEDEEIKTAILEQQAYEKSV